MKKYITPALNVMSIRLQGMIAESGTGTSTPGLEAGDAVHDRSEHLLDGLFD